LGGSQNNDHKNGTLGTLQGLGEREIVSTLGHSIGHFFAFWEKKEKRAKKKNCGILYKGKGKKEKKKKKKVNGL
jgi:hypothetical protein